jgi:hypothetical protein
MRHGKAAARDGGIDEHSVAEDVEKVRHFPKRPSRHESDEPQVAGNMKRNRAADILSSFRLGLPWVEEGEPAAGLAFSC